MILVSLEQGGDAVCFNMIIAFVMLCFVESFCEARTCTYETWNWNSARNVAVGHKKVQTAWTSLTLEERGTVGGCSVCAEDQVEVKVGELPVFRICSVFKERIERALIMALRSGFPIESISAYRVGKSKGPLNEMGERTQFSNHSYGTAIDINAERNGLYDRCAQFGPLCRLLRGGVYNPGKPGVIVKDSIIYKAFKQEGLNWGGEINGLQKDFMHFSLTGM